MQTVRWQAATKLTGLAGDKQMQPGKTDSQAADGHVKRIKLTNRQVTSSQSTGSKGKQPMASLQAKSDNQTGNKLTGLAGDEHVQAARQATDSKLMAVV